jgi:hypothetical protein
VKKIVGVLIIVLALLVIFYSKPVFAADQLQYKWGGAERIRHEYWRNFKDMNTSLKDTRNFFRLKTSLWGQADYGKDLSLYARLTNEFRAHTYFGGTSGSFPDKSASKKGYHFGINEVVFDNLYLDVKNFMDMPVDLRLGRQDLLGTYGEGFLIMDGTPGDGSRTFYFNAAKATWRADEQNSVDLIYINQPRGEEFLPVINRTMLVQQSNTNLNKAPQNLSTTDEEAFVLYWKNKSTKDLMLEGYYIFKTEAEEGGSGLQAKKGEINTFGVFEKYNFAPWVLRSQLAFQFGKYGTEDRGAIGGYAFLDREFKDASWKPVLTVGYAYLSGDEKGTTKNEGWNPLFSRYPWMSELYCQEFAGEAGVSYWTNLQMYRVCLALKPAEKVKLNLGYSFLRANEIVAASSSYSFSGTGKDRGHLFSGKIEYVFNKTVSTYFLAEYFKPKDFYTSDADPAVFLRTEVMIKF